MHKDTNPSAVISTWLDDSVIGMAAKDISEEFFFPLQTATFASLIVASHAVGAAYSVNAPGKNPLPIPLYGIAEQPSNAGKTGVTEALYSGYADKAIAMNAEIRKEREAIKKSVTEKVKSNISTGLEQEQAELETLVEIPIGVSDPTPEGLESSLAESGGFFIAYSTEQGLSKTLLGGLYSEGNKKDDLVLKGFNGEYHKVVRANRDRVTFTGRPYGGVFELSQEGTIGRIMESAGTTGISERFLMMLEGDLIGHRQYLAKGADLKGLLLGDVKPTGDMLKYAKPKRRTALKQYREQMSKFAEIRRYNPSPDMQGLKKLQFSEEAWILVLAAKQLMENRIGEETTRNSFLASMRGKIDLQIMKVAATIHCMDWDINTHREIGLVIDIETTRKAYYVVEELLHGISKIADSNSLYGDNSEDEYVIEYMQEQRRPRTMDEIVRNIKRQKNTPFKFYTARGEKVEKIRECMARMVKSGKVIEDRRSQPFKYSA